MSEQQKLLDTLAAKGELKKTLKSIFHAWPNLADATMKLMDYMVDVIPDANGNLLFQSCLKDAVKDYQEATPHEFGTEAQMVRYLRGLLKQAPSIIDVTVVGGGSEKSVWEPFATTLSQFKADKSGKSPIQVIPSKYCKTERESLRLMLLARIITVRDLQWIDENLTLAAFFGE